MSGQSRIVATTSPANRSAFENNIATLIEAVEMAVTNKDKGNALERLAHFLIGSVSSLSCKYTNLITRSGEIDIVIEYNRSKGTIPLFDELVRYSLVECKNWYQPVGASTIRDFFRKLEKSKIKLGIVFAKNGITGANSGLDAFEEIREKFSSNGVFVVVFSL
jgi:predicted helicase